MANAVASSSRDRPARNRGSMHSLNQYSPREGVIITNEITHSARPTHVRNDTVKIINQYELKHKVGKGQHGEVYLAEDSTKAYIQVAVKCVRRKNKSDRLNKLRRNNQNFPRSARTPLVDQLGSTEHKIRKEIAIMKKLDHPHVVRLLEVIDDPLQDKIYMVMEYLGGGEIKWRSRNDNPLLRVDQTRRICRDVILGLEYLHYQGIIHRDIKPANLLWTVDRRTVKISDFGVSTFSYAQRLTAAGKGNIKDDDTDPILMDESDLSKTAGTPMFLAPEIVADVPYGAESSSTVHLANLQPPNSLQPRKKPPITKAIDVWAFGVTLYGLLFGSLPFQAKTEYEIYQVIRLQDWDVPETMGLDEIALSGRHPKLQRTPGNKEGELIVDLLERLLEKDARKRITLHDVKRHPWITYDLVKPEDWVNETMLTKYLQLKPTADETTSAMSPLRFHWLPKIGRLITSLKNVNVRPQRSFRRTPQKDEGRDNFGVHSEPHIVHVTRHQTSTGNPSRSRREHRRAHDPEPSLQQPQHQPSTARERKRHSRQELARNKSANDVGAKKQSKTFEPWALWDSSASSGPSKRKSTDSGLHVPRGSGTSPLPSPVGSSLATTPVSEYGPGQSPDSERPRGSALQWMRRLGSNRHSSYGSSSLTMNEPGPLRSSRGAHPIPATSPPSRDSVEILGSNVTSRQSSMSGGGPKFTKAMRAASWTAPDFAVHARPSEDMMSLYSGDRHDELDDETLLVGAGGFAHSPVPSMPNSALLSTVSSAQSIGPPLLAGHGHPHAIRAREAPENAGTTPAHALQSAAAIVARQRMASPLKQASPYRNDGDEDDSDGPSDSDVPSYDLTDEDSSPAEPRSRSHSRRPTVRRQSTARPSPASAARRRMAFRADASASISLNDDHDDGGDASFEMQPSTSQRYEAEDLEALAAAAAGESDEDDSSSGEDVRLLEIRTRRPSASAAEASPPRRQDLRRGAVAHAHAHAQAQAHRAKSAPAPARAREGERRPMICT